MRYASVIALVLVLVLALTAPAFAASKGSVTHDITVHTKSGTSEMPVGTVVGSVNLNTTASGHLIVVIKMQHGPDLTDYDVRIWIDGDSEDFIDVLNTNAQGNGNLQIKMDLPETDLDAIEVQLALRPDFTSTPKATPCYVTEPWKTPVPVPLKK